VTVEYRPATIKPEWWETLIHADEPVAVALLRRLLEHELAPAVAAVRDERNPVTEDERDGP
jgi:hypothetical protein